MNTFRQHSRSWSACLLLTCTAALVACSDKAAAPVAEAPRPAYVTAVRTMGSAELPFVGEVRATRRAELAFPVAGKVATVLVEPGDTVKQGQVLATLDEQPLNIQLKTATAEVSRLETQANEARRRLARAEKAREAGATSDAEWTGLQTELAAVEAGIRSASSQRDLATWSLEQARLRAPVSGVVATRLLEAGQAAGPGMPVLAIDGAGRELAILVPATLKLGVGQAVKLQSEGHTADSRILRIAGRQEAGGARKVFLSVPDDALPGSTWTVKLGQAKQGADGVGYIPLRAVTPSAEASAGAGRVLRLGQDGQTTENVPVRLGMTQGEWIEVKEGLRADDRVVVAGGASIHAGTRVKPVAVAR